MWRKIRNFAPRKSESIILEEFHIKNHSAYFLEDGKMESCVEEESEGGLIVNEVIDGASSDINNLYDRLFDIEYGQESCI